MSKKELGKSTKQNENIAETIQIGGPKFMRKSELDIGSKVFDDEEDLQLHEFGETMRKEKDEMKPIELQSQQSAKHLQFYSESNEQ